MVGVLNKDEEENANGETPASQPIGFGAPAPQQKSMEAVAGSSPKGSGSFVNLSKFLEANKDDTQKFSGNVTSGVQAEGEGLIKDVGTKTEGYIGGMKAAPTLSSISGLTTDQLQGEDVRDAFNVTAEEKAGWAPTTDYSTEATKIGNLGTTIKNTETGSGLNDVVSKFHQGKGYTSTAGQKGFDTFLLQKDPNAQANLANLRSWGTGTLANAVSGAQGKVTKAGSDKLKAATDTSEALRLQASEAERGLLNTGADVASQRYQTEAKKISDYEKEFGTTLSDEAKNALISGSFENASNLDTEQLARLNALASLQDLQGYTGGQGVTMDATAARNAVRDKKSKEVSAAIAATQTGSWDENNALVKSHPDLFMSGIDILGRRFVYPKPGSEGLVDELSNSSMINS